MPKKRVLLSLIIPVRDDSVELGRNFPRIYKYLRNAYGREGFEVIISEGGSRDSTKSEAIKLSRYKNVKTLLSKRLGKGFAVKRAIGIANGAIIGFTDIDMPVPLRYVNRAVALIKKGNDIVLGSRYEKGSKTQRNFTDTFMSRVYNSTIGLVFMTKVSDHQCGFKFFRKGYIKPAASKIKSDYWFFDTELIIRARRNNAKIAAMPVAWNQRTDTKSKTGLIDIVYYTKEISRMLRSA